MTKKKQSAPTLAVRHGDVGLIQIPALPEGAVEEPRSGAIVLALGEATGHAHKVMDPHVRVFRVGETRYLVVEGHPADLVQTDQSGRIGVRGDGYDLHGRAPLQTGVYEVRIERDYVRGAVPRQVLD